MQIKSKLTLQYIAIFSLLLVTAMSIIYISFRDELENQFYIALRTKALMTFTMMEKTNPDFDRQPFKTSSKPSEFSVKDNIMIYTQSGDLLFSFSPENEVTPGIINKVLQMGEYKFPIDEYKAIGIKYKSTLGKDYVIIAKGQFMSEELVSLKSILFWTFLIVLLISAFVGYYFADRALLPINKVMNELDSFSSDDLSSRLTPGRNKDEIARLTNNFNGLLARIEESFNIQKGFLSFISHEVRNPLAAINSRIEVYRMKDRSVEEYKSCLDSILKDARELEQMSAQLMQLTRITAGSDKVMFAPVRIDEMVWDVQNSIRNVSEEYRLIIDVNQLPANENQLKIIGNETLLKTAISNLVENACKYSPDHTARIRIYFNNDHSPALDIIDNAQVIPDEERDLIFKPFYRSAAHSKIKGSGIGLSLVALIMNIHKFSLNITPNSVSGNVFTLKFYPDGQLPSLN